MQDIDKMENIRLNKDENDLNCTDINNIKKCAVSKNDFKNKKNGYYYIYHKNNVDKYSINYEAFGVKIIFSNFCRINKLSFALISLLVLLI